MKSINFVVLSAQLLHEMWDIGQG